MNGVDATGAGEGTRVDELAPAAAAWAAREVAWALVWVPGAGTQQEGWGRWDCGGRHHR